MIHIGYAEVEADKSAARKWTSHVGDVANQTLLPTNHSWYLGQTYLKAKSVHALRNGLNNYRIYCDKIAKRKYQGFVFKESTRLS